MVLLHGGALRAFQALTHGSVLAAVAGAHVASQLL